MVLVISVHYPQRELTAKLLLAYKAANKFKCCIIGRTSAIRKHSGQVLKAKSFWHKQKIYPIQGTVVETALTPEAISRLTNFKLNGFNLASFCEEATAFTDPTYFANRCLDSSSASQVDLFFSWGSWHQEAITLSDLEPHKLLVSGHPRLEIYQKIYEPLFRNQKRYILEKYGDFILVNTNIPEYCFSEEVFEQYIARKEKCAKDLGLVSISDLSLSIEKLKNRSTELRQFFENKIKVLNQIKTELNALGCKVIIRPKPMVEAGKLLSYLEGYDFKGFVDGSFSVNPWLQACTAVLHHGCTTSIEAALLGKPAIMLKEGNSFAPPVLEASFVSSDVDAAATMLLDAAKKNIDKETLKQKSNSVRKWFANIDASPSDSILSELQSRQLISRESLPYKRIIMEKCHSPADDYLPKPLANEKGTNQPINANEVSYTIEKLNQLLDGEIEVYQVEKEIFLLKKNDSQSLN